MFSTRIIHLSLVCAIGCSVLIGGALEGYAATAVEPPDGAERVTGPPIQAVLTATFDPSTGLQTTVIVGNCKKQAIAFGPSSVPTTAAAFSAATAASIENSRQRGIAPALCFPPGGQDLVVTGVTNFNNTGTVIGADVSISAVELK
jgi:hypothetical protein